MADRCSIPSVGVAPTPGIQTAEHQYSGVPVLTPAELIAANKGGDFYAKLATPAEM
jgi:hypothetical protein